MGDGRYFSASYDRLTSVLTIVLCSVLLLAPVGILMALHSTLLCSIVFGFAVLTVFLGYAFSPRGYTVSEREITVKRLIGDVRFLLDGKREVRAATRDDLRGCIKLFGSGGLFGYYGMYRTSKLGTCRWYLTNRSKAVIVTAQKTVLFSPDDVESFLDAVGRTAAPGGPERFSGMLEAAKARDWPGMVVGIGVGIFAAGLVAAAMLYNPGPPPYTLTPQSLTIHDRFYPITVQAGNVDVDRVEVVDVGDDSPWRATRRTNGFGNPHYHAGWFRVANGETVRMYRADGRRLVLLPPRGKGSPVLYEVPDPERFVSELRREWRG
jgi:PH (Pleckstrin Homology) domain-containing protein